MQARKCAWWLAQEEVAAAGAETACILSDLHVLCGQVGRSGCDGVAGDDRLCEEGELAVQYHRSC